MRCNVRLTHIILTRYNTSPTAKKLPSGENATQDIGFALLLTGVFFEELLALFELATEGSIKPKEPNGFMVTSPAIV